MYCASLAMILNNSSAFLPWFSTQMRSFVATSVRKASCSIRALWRASLDPSDAMPPDFCKRQSYTSAWLVSFVSSRRIASMSSGNSPEAAFSFSMRFCSSPSSARSSLMVVSSSIEFVLSCSLPISCAPSESFAAVWSDTVTFGPNAPSASSSSSTCGLSSPFFSITRFLILSSSSFLILSSSSLFACRSFPATSSRAMPIVVLNRKKSLRYTPPLLSTSCL
mmetsp:Transcript_3359/g.8908  ORF Transcript_3359/g.8908 Transcript_3359/m.8908 type:complete len:222 (-) Transcript_3359:527-1192(-)